MPLSNASHAQCLILLEIITFYPHSSPTWSLYQNVSLEEFMWRKPSNHDDIWRGGYKARPWRWRKMLWHLAPLLFSSQAPHQPLVSISNWRVSQSHSHWITSRYCDSNPMHMEALYIIPYHSIWTLLVPLSTLFCASYSIILNNITLCSQGLPNTLPVTICQCRGVYVARTTQPWALEWWLHLHGLAMTSCSPSLHFTSSPMCL